MPNFVFLVHGMGVHPPGWSDAWRKCLADNAALFAPYADGAAAFADDVTFVELAYDSVFEDGYRKRWQTLAGALADASLPGALKPLLTELQQEQDARIPAFFWTHLLDPLLWFSLRQPRQAVIARVAAQLGKGLKEAQAKEAKVHLLAHSLGTSVLHDALLCLAADEPAVFDPKKGGYRWSSLVTIANVSRLLGAFDSPSDSLPLDAFRPHDSRVQSGDLADVFVNVRHRADPFTFPRTFKPDWKTPPYWLEQPDRFDELLRVHDLETQFDHPLVARRCLRLFTGRKGLGTTGEMDAAWRRYEQRYGKNTQLAFPKLHELLVPDTERMLGIGELARYLFTYAKEALG